MVAEKTAPDSVAEILSRAFDSSAAMPPAAAELVLKARFPEMDLKRVDALLEKKRDAGLNPDEEELLRDYLHVDSVLTVLKSRARRDLQNAKA